MHKYWERCSNTLLCLFILVQCLLMGGRSVLTERETTWMDWKPCNGLYMNKQTPWYMEWYCGIVNIFVYAKRLAVGYYYIHLCDLVWFWTNSIDIFSLWKNPWNWTKKLPSSMRRGNCQTLKMTGQLSCKLKDIYLHSHLQCQMLQQ